MILALLLVLAQDPFPKAGSDPTGVVFDEQGARIAGASVALVAGTDFSAPFARAIAQMLAKVPLPSAFSDRDGEFVLPLTGEQRTLGAAGEGEFWLVVKKDGYRDWKEPLSGGIASYLGSRVVLPRWRFDDPFALVPWPPVIAREPTGVQRDFISLTGARDEPTPHRRGAQRQSPSDPSRLSGALVVQVVDGEGAAVAHATLRCSNTCFALGEPTDALPRTDAEGRARVAPLEFGQHEVLVLASGFMPGRVRVKISSREPLVEQVMLVAADDIAVLTVDAAGQPVPFASAHRSEARLALLAGVRSDSCARMRFRAARGKSFWLLATAPGAVSMELTANGQLVRLVVPRCPAVLLRTDPIERIDAYGWLVPGRPSPRHGYGYQGGPSTAFLVECIARDAGAFWCVVPGRPPIWIESAELPPRRASGFDLVEIQRTASRRIPLDVRGPDGETPAAVLIEPRIVHGLTQIRSNMAERAADGTWSFVTRDDGAWRCAVKSDGYYERELLVPAREPGKPDLKLVVELVRITESGR